MSDRSYYWARLCCYPFFWVCSRPVVLHRRRAAIRGGYILAPNHLSHFDAPLLIGHAPRHVDLLALVDLGRKRWARGLLSLFNVFYLDRRCGGRAMRTAVRRLRQGGVIGWFPEGGVRAGDNSVVKGGPIHPGIARIAAIAGVPVIPCVVLGGAQYRHVRNWLPLRRTRYGINFGNPLRVNPDFRASEARERFLRELQQAYVDLGRELVQKMSGSIVEPQISQII